MSVRGTARRWAQQQQQQQQQQHRSLAIAGSSSSRASSSQSHGSPRDQQAAAHSMGTDGARSSSSRARKPAQIPMLESSRCMSSRAATGPSGSAGSSRRAPPRAQRTSPSSESSAPPSSSSSSSSPPPPSSSSKPPAEHRWNYNTTSLTGMTSWSTSGGPGGSSHGGGGSVGDADDEVRSFRRVTARDLRRRTQPPLKVGMLVRDWVDDCLYNPHYGYFPKQVQIFDPAPTPAQPPPPPPYRGRRGARRSDKERADLIVGSAGQGIDIASLPNLTAFQERVAEMYESVEQELQRQQERESSSSSAVTSDSAPGQGDGAAAAAASGNPAVGALGRQVWHTPTELFKPHYARCIARALLQHYKLHHYPYADFKLYEVGAGNGSLAVDVMHYIRTTEPEVFDRTSYTIVEISGLLAGRQRERITAEGLEGKVNVIHSDFFDWEPPASAKNEPCYFVALEVFDNFAHDMVRYDTRTLEPYQAVVTVDGSGDFGLVYEPVSDPLIQRCLAYRDRAASSPSPELQQSSRRRRQLDVRPTLHPLLLASPILRRVAASAPFAPNLSRPDFLPTKQTLFLERLRDRLPRHRLLVADFDSLPDAVPGRMGPVVQTRYGNSMIPCETFLTKQGYFDIFFPTDFDVLREVYGIVMQPSAGQTGFFSRPDLLGLGRRDVQVYSHADFLTKFGGQDEIRSTTTRDGGNVMLGMYRNAKFMF